MDIHDWTGDLMVFTGTYAIKIGVCFDHRSSLSAQKIAATRRHRKREPAGWIIRIVPKGFDEYIWYIYIIDLGKLSYFTNLNCWAMWGWFHYKNHDFQWGRSEVVIIYPIIYIYIFIYIYIYIYLSIYIYIYLYNYIYTYLFCIRICVYI